MKKLSALFLLFLGFYWVNAQPGCPAVSVPADFNLPCTQQCTTLTANFFGVGATNTYTVSSIPYTPFPYNGGTNVLVNIDDTWSNAINLPFTFCFFGQPKTQFFIGSNGIITFDPTIIAGSFCVWSTDGLGTLPTNTMYTDAIMGPYHDIDPSLGGNINYQLLGVAPCRTFIISWNQIPMFNSDDLLSNCSSTGPQTQQIVLYETTNVIEIYIQNKEACTDWNSGFAIEGIQDATGTTAFVVPGRNNSVWNATNDAWRFTPNGPSIVNVDWSMNGTPIDTGATIQICPTTYGVYTAAATYTPCAGGTPVTVTDDIFVGTLSLAVNIDSVQDASCGQNNGVIYASYNTTSAVLGYGFTPGPSNVTTMTGAAPGTYIFHVDIAGCTRYDTAVVVNGGSMAVTVNDSTFTACAPPGTNGVLAAWPNGGSSPYSFSWSNTQSGQFATGLSAGNYTVTVTDAGGCTATDGGTVIYNYQSPSFNAAVLTDATCNGGNDGQIVVSTQNMQLPINYNWSGGLPNNDTVSGIFANTYTVTATDVNGCTVSASYTINEPAAIILSAPVITDVTCSTAGSITASASGGTGLLTYSWSNTQSGASITGLAAGPYDLTVTDGNLCSITTTYTVGGGVGVITFSAPTIVDVLCNGGSDGSITVNATGGNPPLNFVWSNSQAGATVSSLNANSYSVTASDNNGCSASTTYTVNEPTSMSFGVPTIVDVSCFSQGSITTSASGGTGVISLVWSNGMTGAGISGLNAGLYTVTATDQNACSVTVTYTVGTSPGAITITNPVVTNVSCNGGSDGSISITTGGGTGALTIAWSNLQNTASINGLIAGNYSVTVTDAIGCSASASYTITEPMAISATVSVTDAYCFGSPNGTITASPQGGTSPYSYLWNDVNSQTTQTATVSAGPYTCTVSDANNCSVTTGGFVNEPTDMVPAPVATAVKCIGDENGTITIAVFGGTGPYSYSATQDNVNYYSATNGVILNLKMGDYTVQITDANGCTKTIIVNVPDAEADNFVVSTDSTSCYGDEYTDGAAHIFATSVQNSPYQFSIDGSTFQFSGDFYNLAAGTHTITAISNNGCTSEVPALVLQPLPIVVDVVPDTIVLPLGESQSVVVNYLNVTGTPSYTWEPSLGLSCIDCPNPTVSVYLRSDYVITVSSQSGNSVCYGSATLHVEVEPHKPVFIPNSFSPNGDGNNDLFLVYGEDIETVFIRIFNRWGEKVFETDNQFQGWDGTYKGALQNPQVFTYKADIVFLNDKRTQKKGSVTILR